MASVMEIMQLCRLCLVKDEVNIPIFEEKGDLREIFLKISACLPVKVAREDNLPKNICDGCSYKLELLYEFWNTSANSEKQLLKWLSQVGVKKASTSDKVASVKMQPHSINSDNVVLKQEVVDLGDSHGSDDELDADDLNVSNDAQDYILQQQQLPYQPVTFEFQQEGFTEGEATSSTAGPSATITSEAAPKRKRRAAAMKALPPHIDSEEEDEDDVDMVETKIAKTEEQSDDSASEDPEPTTFVGLPSTSTDNEQPGPSGVGKGAAEAPPKKSREELDADVFDVSRIKVEVEEEGGNVQAGLKKKLHKCGLCREKFFSVTELNAHHQVQHPILGKRRPMPKDKLEIIDENLSNSSDDEGTHLLFSTGDETDDDEDELEIVLGDNTSVATEELKKIYASQPQGEQSSQDVDVFCVICDNGKKMNQQQLTRHYRKHEKLFASFNEGTFSKIKQDPKIDDLTPQYYCHICKDNKQMTKSELNDHYQANHDVKITNKKQFFRRARSKRPRSPRPEVFRCEICSAEFGTQQNLNKHFEEHNDQYSCDICDTGFKKLIDYTFHMQSHSDDKLYKCPLCQFVTDKGYLVKSHLYSVHEQFKKYKCEVCNKGFAIFTHFQEHKYFHTGEKPFRCEICGQKFMYTRYLNSHKVQMHKNAQKGIECKICKKVYSHRNSLNTHMKSHTGVVSVCDVCGKTFSSNEKLRLHYRIHTGEKPYKCDYCDKTFKTSSYRAEHERIHTGEKPYECPYCEKGFSQRTSMVIHSRGHTGEKPYVCHLCNKGFAAKSMVTIHLKSCKGGLIHHIEDN